MATPVEIIQEIRALKATSTQLLANIATLEGIIKTRKTELASLNSQLSTANGNIETKFVELRNAIL